MPEQDPWDDSGDANREVSRTKPTYIGGRLVGSSLTSRYLTPSELEASETSLAVLLNGKSGQPTKERAIPKR